MFDEFNRLLKADQSIQTPIVDPIRIVADLLAGPIVGVADAAIEQAAVRFVPNPAGKLGSVAHRAAVREAADEIEAEGGRIVAGGGRLAERSVDVGGRVRFPDIQAFKADGTRVFVNIGRVTKAGTPIAREARALNDLNGTGVHTFFKPYKP